MRMRVRFGCTLLAYIIFLTACSFAGPKSGSGLDRQKGTGIEEQRESAGLKNKQSAPLVEVSIMFRTYMGISRDIDEVMGAVNGLLEKEANIRIKPIFTETGVYEQQLKLMVSARQAPDLVVLKDKDYPSLANTNMFLPLDDLLKSHGLDILEAFNDYRYLLEATRINGKIWAIPALENKVALPIVYMRKDILEKYGFAPGDIKSYKDFDRIYEVIHRNEPDMTCLMNTSYTLAMTPTWLLGSSIDSLGDGIGVLMGDNNYKVVNMYESEAYLETINLFRSWYLKGYTPRNIGTTTERGSQVYRSGTLFSYFAGSSRVDLEDSVKFAEVESGFETVGCYIAEPRIPFLKMIWSIPATSRNPESAMKFLNLVYTNKELVNLLYYGIEGKHYVVNAKGMIDYPAGVNAKNTGYDLQLYYQLGNSLISRVWRWENPDRNKIMSDNLKNFKRSPSLGFVFDSSTVKDQYSAVKNIINQYATGLENGSIDPKSRLPEFISKLKTAGIDKIIAEKQKQLDAWLAQKNP